MNVLTNTYRNPAPHLALYLFNVSSQELGDLYVATEREARDLAAALRHRGIVATIYGLDGEEKPARH